MGSSDEIQKAVERARAELPDVRTRYSSGDIASGTYYVSGVKGRTSEDLDLTSFDEDDRFWIVVQSWADDLVAGEVSMPPVAESSLTIGRRITIRERAIVDWKIAFADGVEGDFIDRASEVDFRSANEGRGDERKPYVPDQPEDKYEDDEEDDDRTYAVLNPGASEDQIKALVKVLPIAPPEIWLNVLRVADGFETGLRSPFWTMPTDMMISMASQRERWAKKFVTELPNVVPVAVAVDGGFFVLDLDTMTPDGDCMVVRMTAGTTAYEESRQDSVGLWLADSLNEDDWDKFRPTLPPLPKQSIEYDLIDGARRGHIREVERLLDKGADVNAADRFGSALEQATDCGHDAVVQLLKARGARTRR